MPPSPTDLAARLGKQNPFESPEQEAYLHLLRAHNRLAAPIDRVLKAHAISQPLYNILRILRGHLGRSTEAREAHHGVPVLRVAEEMVTREPDITRLVDRLEKAGLAERCRCKADRRIIYVRITARGLDLLDRLGPEIDRIHRAQFGCLSREELGRLNALLFRASESGEPAEPAPGDDPRAPARTS
jgi:DNA-binding MarR family transcriptional regulator